ncbi:MAG: carboxylating nicotinate-nucleotide diphosphorylase [Planctomycetaceae bacterium]|nr:MAG: carboxylating nicotinate-nucleotide diphosphorylase [Planctomycetaceae bacterium]
MTKEFQQIQWDQRSEDDCRQIIRLAVREDLDRQYDWTTVALASPELQGQVAVVARQPGVIAGLQAVPVILDEMEIIADWEPLLTDGQIIQANQVLARLGGAVRDLLAAERLLLNLIGRLSGIATLTRRYVSAVADTKARIYDTRKTTPGWRRLEKYAVRCGGGCNHRTGLFDAVLIKDNHLALSGLGPDEAVRRVRAFLQRTHPADEAARMVIEVEVDTLEQFESVLPIAPDLVLLDNMSIDQLARAVARRDAIGAAIQLEASGGVHLDTVAAIAATGVDRISVGALTHSAISLDMGLDWHGA